LDASGWSGDAGVCGLPEAANGLLIEDAVAANERNIKRESLSGEEAVEWIAMVKRQ
jgi:hypothetical protein